MKPEMFSHNSNISESNMRRFFAGASSGPQYSALWLRRDDCHCTWRCLSCARATSSACITWIIIALVGA
jgi:hypothetical protein